MANFYISIDIFNCGNKFNRQAFASLERDYLHWIDEYLTQQSENGDEIKESTDQVTKPDQTLNLNMEKFIANSYNLNFLAVQWDSYSSRLNIQF